ncbi:hypothetical protein ACF0H5_023072 [Mactra antiquata]
MRGIVVTGLILAIIATIACIVSTDITYWIDNRDIKEHYGLWEYCRQIQTDVMECVSLLDSHLAAWFQAVRVFAVAGCILLLTSTILAGVYLRQLSNRLLPLVASSVAIFGGVCCVISIIIYGVEKKEQKSYFGASFYLQIPAAVLAFTAGALFFGARRVAVHGYDSI